MIELKQDQLIFRFPAVHDDAALTVEFQRTLRIPDDGKDYPLPAGLGRFPLRHVDDHADGVPARWLEHGGVMLPMYQSEALWLNFGGRWGGYPCAVKVAAGKIDAVTGRPWDNGLHARPQDYLVVPEQPWLDGYCVAKGVIRQFVAMPLGSGYSAEEQITGEAEHGGLQIIAYPMKREVYERQRRRLEDTGALFGAPMAVACRAAPDMGLAPGGRMRQEIFRDHNGLDAWDREHVSRCFVHIGNSLIWRAITGEAPPTTPLTSREYKHAGIPWFEYYGEGEAVEGSDILAGIKSIFQLGKQKGDAPLPDNESVTPEHVVQLRKGLAKHQVREGRF